MTHQTLAEWRVSKKTTVLQQGMPQQEPNQFDHFPNSESVPGLGEDAGLDSTSQRAWFPWAEELLVLSPFEK